MNENVIEIAEEKVSMKERIVGSIRNVPGAVMDFMDKHSEGIMSIIVYGGTTILFGQCIHYMHTLNKAAKDGKFFNG